MTLLHLTAAYSGKTVYVTREAVVAFKAAKVDELDKPVTLIRTEGYGEDLMVRETCEEIAALLALPDATASYPSPAYADLLAAARRMLRWVDAPNAAISEHLRIVGALSEAIDAIDAGCKPRTFATAGVVGKPGKEEGE